MRTLTKPMVSLAVLGALMARPTLPVADQPTRIGGVAGLAEITYAQRGGIFLLGGPAGLQGEVESDWLAGTVAPILHAGVGVVAVHLYGGPTVEVHVRTRTAAELRTTAYWGDLGDIRHRSTEFLVRVGKGREVDVETGG